ncbi:hypothetical protein HZS_1877, partial [Henneguya salminicola]
MRIPTFLRRLLRLNRTEEDLELTRSIWKNVTPTNLELHENNLSISNKVKTSRFRINYNSKIGDILQISSEDEFPCDLVLLSSSNPSATCYITTVNFDGETNLKLRYCVPSTCKWVDPGQFGCLACTIECDLPNHDLYKFNGKLSVSDSSSLVHDTKLNRFIFLMIVILVLGSALVTILHYSSSGTQNLWYLDKSYFHISVFDVFVNIACFAALLNHLIPISLSVTLEIEKFWNSFFIDWDLEMYHSKSDDPARSNSSDTIEELGQIEYIFTDKTGTLTENRMVFKKCVIDNIIYKKNPRHLQSNNLYNWENMNEKTVQFFTFICLCHSAEADLIKDNIPSNNALYKYMSPSPDEVALLEGAESLGIIYKGRVDGSFIINIGSTEKHFKIKHTLEFTPERKRMSVIFQNEQGEYYLVCKGADSHVLPLGTPSDIRDDLSKHIDSFARKGFRTLAFGYKKMTENEYEETEKTINKADISVLERGKNQKKAYEKIEKDLILIGATAVDDRLQEGVTETIRDLRVAGIKIWVLTGDKEETAVSISLKCGHLSPNTKILYLCQRVDDLKTQVYEYIETLSQSSKQEYSLVLDGNTLKILLRDFKYQTVKMFILCSTVLCCRMSPLQKSKIVNFVRKNLPNRPITLAIGDGANDCSMIQEAHVGIGVMGQEGRQAVYSSDFAIHRFRYLKKLLLFHGFNFYYRFSITILYFFYKNFIMCCPMFIFVWYTNFSPTSLYDDAEITMYNTLVTSMPVIVYGIFEQPYFKKTLMENPKLYRYSTITRNALLSWKLLFFWLFNALWQSLVIFYWCMLVYNGGMINIPDQYFTYNLFGTMIFTYVVICVTFQIQLLTRFWTLHAIVSTVGSLVYFVIAEIFVALLYGFNSTSTVFSTKFQSYYVFFNMLSYAHFWCGLIIIIPIAFFPYLIATFYSQFKMAQTLNGNTIRRKI